MLTRFILLLAVLAIALGAYTMLCRPCLCPAPEITAQAFATPKAAQADIQASEAKVSDLRPGMEKEIIWNGEPFQKTEYAVVYVHGFSASKEELRPVPDLIAKKLEANLFYTRLEGHGQLPGSLGTASIEGWLNDIVEAANVGRAIGNKVIIIATSTGGSLSTWLAADKTYADNIAAIVFVSPNYGLTTYAAPLLRLPFARQILPILLGPTRGFTPANQEHAYWWTPDYPTQALIPMANAIDLANTSEISAIEVPAYFVFSPNDKVVNGRATLRVIDRWGAPTQHLIVDTLDNKTNHVPAGHVLSPSTTGTVTTHILEWLTTSALK